MDPLSFFLGLLIGTCGITLLALYFVRQHSKWMQKELQDLKANYNRSLEEIRRGYEISLAGRE